MVFSETETIELKSVVVDDVKKEIIAFANCKGGKLYIGVQDDGTIIGLENPDQAALQVSNMVRDSVKPDLALFLHYETITVDGKKILEIDVQQGTERPYYLAKKGMRPEGVYVRQGYSSAPATNTAIRRMIKETDGDHFEDMRALEQRLTFTIANKAFSERNVNFGSSQMKTLGLLTQDGIFTNLALLLSDQCRHTIKAAVFQDETQSQFRDRKEFSGSLFQQMEDVYAYIDYRNQVHSTFDRLHRIDKRDYPEIAVREALLNLLVHREYAYGASTLISIYSDRIEFTSIGGLMSGFSLNDLSLGISVCRNPKLANVFYRLELIEAYGTGITKIMRAYNEADLKPRIESSDNAFKIVLPNLNFRINSENNESIHSSVEKPEEKIIKLAKRNKYVTRREIEEMLSVSQATSGRLLKKMVNNALLVQEGRGKNVRYRLPE